MTNQIFGLAFISIVVGIDNALLAGMILPWTSAAHKKEIMVVVGIGLGICQIAMAIGVGHLLTHLVFRVLAIVVLVWMSIRTLVDISPTIRSRKKLGVMWKVFFYTALGNLDNMIWLGSELKGQYFWLVAFSILTIPLFIVVAIFLSDQCEKHHWILIIGSGMMAWAAAGLVIETPGWKLIGNYLALPVPQILVGLVILSVGFMTRLFTVRRRVL